MVPPPGHNIRTFVLWRGKVWSSTLFHFTLGGAACGLRCGTVPNIGAPPLPMGNLNGMELGPFHFGRSCGSKCSCRQHWPPPKADWNKLEFQTFPAEEKQARKWLAPRCCLHDAASYPNDARAQPRTMMSPRAKALPRTKVCDVHDVASNKDVVSRQDVVSHFLLSHLLGQ